MPNKKLSELEQIVDISIGDTLLITDISAAVDEKSKKVTVQQFDARYATFLPGITPLGEMWQSGAGILTGIIVATEFVKVENFTAGILQNMTFADNALTTEKAGKFKCDIALAGNKDSGVNTRTYDFMIYVNGIANDHLRAVRSFTNDTIGALTITGLLELEINDVIDLRVACLDDNIDFEVVSCNLNITGQ